MKALVLVLVLVLASPAAAQVGDQPGAWAPGHRKLADAIGTVAVYGQIGADTWASWTADDRRHAFVNQACRVGLAAGVAFGLKALFPEARPEGGGLESCCSGHTAQAVASAGYRLRVSLPIAIGVGYSRVAANRHHWKDIGVGALIGAGAQLACWGLVRPGTSIRVTGL